MKEKLIYWMKMLSVEDCDNVSNYCNLPRIAFLFMIEKKWTKRLETNKNEKNIAKVKMLIYNVGI